ncbi:MAG: DUF222 domain-containing protein, partial [Pseudonocardiaceae bacterium]
QAQLLAVMAEIGLCDPNAEPDEVARLTEAPEYAADEIRAALAWTRNAAYREFHFAQELRGRLPAVFTALDSGVICRSKAWLFTDLCATLTDEQIEAVCQRLLPQAGRLTTGELAARIKKLAIALDPEWAARRYATAVRERDVIGYLDEDGTATVTGRRLPADQAATACARIEDLARAAKRAGHPGRIGHLRADIYVGLLEGRWQHRTREEIITDLLASATLTDSAIPTAQDPTPGNASDGTDHAAADPATPGDEDSRNSEGGVARPTARDRVGVEVRVGLSTLLGRDRHPGEIPGWGPVTAETARALAAAQHTAQWRYAITDPEGRLILAGITRRRPTTLRHSQPGAGSPPASQAPARGGIVELHIPATLLTDLATHPETGGPGGQWAEVIADIAAQYATYRAHQAQPDTGRLGRQDPRARFAGAALRRHVQVRDRTCVHPGCRCPAQHADLDHTIDHAHGGVTVDINSGPMCRHDHGLKHRGGWRLRQPEAGHFIWTSPLGRIYHTRPQPITTDLPDPLPGPEYPAYPPPSTLDDDGPIFYRPPPEPEPPPSPARTVDPDEPPPF